MQRHWRTSSISVLNQAAGGNRILHDGLGPNAVSRVDRDVLAQSGIRYAMIWEGVNDIGTADATPEAQKEVGDRLIVAFKQIATRIHAAEIPIFAATISPFGTRNNASYVQPYSDPEREKTRLRINDFIRHSGTFDEVIDFDKALRDPENHSVLRKDYDLGDHLHPSEKGYHHIADIFPLRVFDDYKLHRN